MKTQRKCVLLLVLIGCVGMVSLLSACNTVRGVAKDVEEAADALDPDKN